MAVTGLFLAATDRRTPPRRRMLAAAAAALVLALALAAPPAASASSIVFIKDWNVWLAAPDGSAQRQLTRDGSEAHPYSHPTQADDGTIVATRGSRLQLLGRDGKALKPALKSVLTDSPPGAFGPFGAEISPDAQTIAYWIGITSGWKDWATGIIHTSTAESVVFQRTSDGHPIGQTLFHQDPSWLGDGSGLLLFNPTNRTAPQAVFAAPAIDHNAVRPWFTDGDTFPLGTPPGTPYADVGDGELTRAGDKLAAVRGGSQLWLYATTASGAPPRMSCVNTGPTGGQFADPTWSPDGRGLAWAEADGIWTAGVGTVSPEGCGDAFASQRLTIPGGYQPDWGPADVGSAPAPGAQPRPVADTRAPTLRLRARSAASLRRLLAGRLAVTATASEDSTLTATLTVDRRTARRIGLGRARTIAHGKRTTRAGAATAVKLHATRSARRALGRAKRLTATLTIVATDSAGNPSRARRARLNLR